MSDRDSSSGSNKSSNKSSKKQHTTKRKRCPKGTRRNKHGDCIPLSVFQSEQKTQTRKRCPKGTRRNEAGDCVPSSGAISTAATTTSIEKPVLKGNTELVQFSFNSEQLKTFEPVINNSPSSGLSWLNVIYALGLIDKKRMEKEVHENGKKTMSTNNVVFNIPKMFGDFFLNRNHVMNSDNKDPYLLEDIKSYENTIKNNIYDIKKILKDSLHDNHATIVSMLCVDRTHFPAQDTWYHYLIAYKSKWTDKEGDHEEVELYDPQNKRWIFELGGKIFNYEILGNSIHNYISRNELRQYKKELYYMTYFTFSSIPKKNIPLKPKISSFFYEYNSPLTAYATRHFSAPIKVLGHHSLFQVSFTPEQLDEYVDFMYKNGVRYKGGACVIHTLFALGLRNVREAKKDAQISDYRARREMVQGNYSMPTARYLESIMKIPKGSLKVLENKCTGKNVDDELKRTMDLLLENNHATPFVISYYNNTYNKDDAHGIIAYKRNNKIELYDPQTDRTNKNRLTLKNIMKRYGVLDFKKFRTYHFENYKTQDDILIDDTTCRLRIGDSPGSDSGDDHMTIERKGDHHKSLDSVSEYPTSL